MNKIIAFRRVPEEPVHPFIRKYSYEVVQGKNVLGTLACRYDGRWQMSRDLEDILGIHGYYHVSDEHDRNYSLEETKAIIRHFLENTYVPDTSHNHLQRCMMVTDACRQATDRYHQRLQHKRCLEGRERNGEIRFLDVATGTKIDLDIASSCRVGQYLDGVDVWDRNRKIGNLTLSGTCKILSDRLARYLGLQRFGLEIDLRRLHTIISHYATNPYQKPSEMVERNFYPYFLEQERDLLEMAVHQGHDISEDRITLILQEDRENAAAYHKGTQLVTMHKAYPVDLDTCAKWKWGFDSARILHPHDLCNFHTLTQMREILEIRVLGISPTELPEE